MAEEIDRAPSLEAVEAIANAAAGYQRQFKPVREVADRAGEVWVNAETKIGSELAKMPKAKGTRGQFRGKARGEGSSGAPLMETPDDTPRRRFFADLVFVWHSFSVLSGRGPLRRSSCQLLSNWRNWRTGAKRRTLKRTGAPVVRQLCASSQTWLFFIVIFCWRRCG
jgi:hypothetical protein